MAKKPLIIAIAAIFLIVLIVGISYWVYLRAGRNNPPTAKDNAFVMEEYENNNCRFRIQEGNTKKQILCSFLVHQELPIYIFRITGSRGENAIERIEIFPENEPDSVQTFSSVDTYPVVERVFEVEDINFDGYLDIRTLAWYGTAGFIGYQYWVFNTETKMFELNKTLANLANPKPLPEKKQILADDPKEGSVTYEWQDGVLIRVP